MSLQIDLMAPLMIDVHSIYVGVCVCSCNFTARQASKAQGSVHSLSSYVGDEGVIMKIWDKPNGS